MFDLPFVQYSTDFHDLGHAYLHATTPTTATLAAYQPHSCIGVTQVIALTDFIRNLSDDQLMLPLINGLTIGTTHFSTLNETAVSLIKLQPKVLLHLDTSSYPAGTFCNFRYFFHQEDKLPTLDNAYIERAIAARKKYHL